MAQGGFCTTCRAPVHKECARGAAKGAGACAACGAPARRAEPEPPLGPPRATPKDVRTLGVFAIVLGLGIAFLLQDYRFRVGIPVAWIGYLAVGIGLCMLAIPVAFEDHVSRIMRPPSKWIPAPAPARAASPGAAASVTFEGAYEPPVFTTEHRPFPLRGKGRLAIHARGIGISGTRLLSLSMPGTILLLVAIPSVGIAVVVAAGVPGLAVLLGIVVACALLLRRRQRPVTILIPWENIHGFLRDPKGKAVRILVRKMKPSGEVWFVPVEGPDPLLSALLERGVAEECEDLGL